MTGRPPMPAVARPCPHSRRHEHGTSAAYKADQCRCTPCRAACAREQRARHRDRAYGRHQTHTVPSVAATRRLRALAILGWSPRTLAAHIPGSMEHLQRIRSGRKLSITRIVDQRIARLYDALWNQQPPRATADQRSAADRSMRHAAARGWLPPAAWDDDSIHDPSAVPTVRVRLVDGAPVVTDRGKRLARSASPDDLAATIAAEGHAVLLSAGERTEAIRRMTDAGLSAATIAERLRVTPRTVQRARLSRAA